MRARVCLCVARDFYVSYVALHESVYLRRALLATFAVTVLFASFGDVMF